MSQGWRGVVGYVKPSYWPGSLERLIRLLPEGIGVIPLYAGAKSGTQEDLANALKVAEQRVDELASIGIVDVIYIGGAPPPMLLGYDADHKLAQRLTQKHGIPVILTTTALVEALRALSVKRLIAITYFGDELNRKFAQYLTDAGFEPAAIQGIAAGEFKDVGKIPAGDIYAAAKKTFLKAGGADAIFLLGGVWESISIIERLEQDLQTTVVGGEQIDLWVILRALRIREPIKGYGKLLSELP